MRERRTRLQSETQKGKGIESLPGSIPIRQRPRHLSIEKSSNSPGRTARKTNRREVQGVYIISVAARLLEMHPQTLRKYERMGLVHPGRTVGMLRLYSESDLKKLRLIRYLENEMGMNLAGVRFILSLVDQLMQMRERLTANANHQNIDAAVDGELTRLFRELDLPLSIWR